MPDFIETPRFPEDISYGSRGGPSYNTRVVQVDSGALIRNSLWAYAQHNFNVAYGINTLAKLEALVYFFHAVAHGRAVGFRYKDWLDYKSCLRSAAPSAGDVWFATGDGATASFQLYKGYTAGSSSQARPIYKPVSGTMMIAVGGTAKTESTHYTVNYATGMVTFTAGNIPAAGQHITAGFEFDVPVCFASDELSVNIEDYNSGMAQVMLTELKYGST